MKVVFKTLFKVSASDIRYRFRFQVNLAKLFLHLQTLLFTNCVPLSESSVTMLHDFGSWGRIYRLHDSDSHDAAWHVHHRSLKMYVPNCKKNCVVKVASDWYKDMGLGLRGLMDPWNFE